MRFAVPDTSVAINVTTCVEFLRQYRYIVPV